MPHVKLSLKKYHGLIDDVKQTGERLKIKYYYKLWLSYEI